MNNKIIILPSGAELTIQLAPFVEAKELYQAVLEELKGLKINSQDEIDANLFKDIFCAGFSSKKIERTLDNCLKRCLYDGIKITNDTWEPVKAREDYMKVCIEVAKENIMPFGKALMQEFSQVFSAMKKDHA